MDIEDIIKGADLEKPKRATREDAEKALGKERLENFEEMSRKIDSVVTSEMLKSEDPMLIITALAASLDALISSVEMVYPIDIRGMISHNLSKSDRNEIDK